MKAFIKSWAITGLLSLIVFVGGALPVEAVVNVKGYYRSNGTYVQPHVRSNPNGLKYDNYSYKPSQGLYNPTYGTRGSEWDAPTWVTDPDYYTGKNLYEGLGGSNNKIAPVVNLPLVVPPTPPKVTLPANAYLYGNSWFCNSGYKRIGNTCEKVFAPLNAYIYGSAWFCNSGYKKVGNTCEEVIAPANAYVYGGAWFCDSGYRKVGSECQQVIAPSNAYVYGGTWFCNSGYKRIGNVCEKVIAPANSFVYGSAWFCNLGYRKVGNGCVEVN